MIYKSNKNFLALQRDRYNLHMFDIPLLAAVLAVSVIGVYVINSAADGYAGRQAAGIVAGLIIAVFLSLVDYNYIAKFDRVLYAINIVMLIAVLLFGVGANGARRWFSVGPLGAFQPSELSKLFMIIIFASFISRSRDKMGSFKNFLKLLIIYMIPVGLIVVEPDLSTSIVFVFLFIIMMFVGELGTRIILWILGISVPTLALFFWYIQQPGQKLLHGYQLSRVLSFLHPQDYLLTTYYQQYNSIMAIGSGMLTGKGLNNNTITSVKGGDFISEPQTDFIFAVLGEELGFVGCCIVLALLFLIVIRCLVIAKNASNGTGRLIAVGVAAVIIFQTFVNVGVATGIIPNTGLTLPFVSYGLSSLLSNYMMIGLVLNVGLQRNRR
ncbi:MAG: FtsW/RodA/SpoVE family cell cycle protein [Lachnospiraceae bacterium]|jgi:rod shape determining protein RodA